MAKLIRAIELACFVFIASHAARDWFFPPDPPIPAPLLIWEGSINLAPAWVAVPADLQALRDALGPPIRPTH